MEAKWVCLYIGKESVTMIVQSETMETKKYKRPVRRGGKASNSDFYFFFFILLPVDTTKTLARINCKYCFYILVSLLPQNIQDSGYC